MTTHDGGPVGGRRRPIFDPVRVTLRVPDMGPALDFYRGALGLASEGVGDRVGLVPEAGAGPVIQLEEAPDAPAPPRRSVGLFHLALRVPDRRALARALTGLRRVGARLQGASDHGVSEAIYLADPHGNGVEIYADRPREEWEWRDGEVRMVTEPLDVENLLGELEGDGEGEAESGEPLLSPGTDLGHVHLKVTDLERAEAFYSGVLGFSVTTRSYPGALFFGAGGYHHHVGANVWTTAGGEPRPEGALGLVEVAFTVPGARVLEEVAERARTAGFEARGEAGSLTLEDGDGIPVRLELRASSQDSRSR